MKEKQYKYIEPKSYFSDEMIKAMREYDRKHGFEPAVTFEEAKDIAQEINDSINYCMEYSDAYIFSDKNNRDIGCNGPIVILKSTGEAISMVTYTDLEGELVFVGECEI